MKTSLLLYDEAEKQIEMKMYINFSCEMWVNWADVFFFRWCFFMYDLKIFPLIFKILIQNTAKFQESIIMKFCKAKNT